MKKMMTAFAACMIAGLVSAQVESANIVGYQTTTVPAGFTVYSPTFSVVGGANPTFASITGSFQFLDNLQFFDADGNVKFMAFWCDDTVGVEPGWYMDDYATSLASTEIPVGQSFFVSAASDVSMTVAGEVGSTNITVNCEVGFTAVGNPRPYAITYADLVCSNMSFLDNLQFFDVDGNVSSMAFWCDDTVGVDAGWYLDDYSTSLSTVEIPAGQGFFFSSQNGGSTCTIPAKY